ncbi:predicted protein [Plenodomus lingam JN3]|uniref:Predicted protein n=1 Tax=Leptosphaeria maculans (strain JN3 / isolate v23.1.3 / race Av1-4-5-6-7-8) TaxID=985895 RepID=E5A2J4_LEPMJ|nr:predicted protein [Plenodomus lingam JN3]CBX97790.1 predicted protein [Plenodomus lingam JN3]
MSPSLLTEPNTHPVPRSKAPWTLHAETYLLFVRMAALPEGVYDGAEEAWGRDEMGGFEGGFGVVMIVRYGRTPVGMLDVFFWCLFSFSFLAWGGLLFVGGLTSFYMVLGSFHGV